MRTVDITSDSEGAGSDDDVEESDDGNSSPVTIDSDCSENSYSPRTGKFITSGDYSEDNDEEWEDNTHSHVKDSDDKATSEADVNFSRVDPKCLTYRSSSKNSYVAFTNATWKTALCISVILVNSSFVGRPNNNSAGGPRKEIRGFFHSQEFERFAGMLGAVFHGQEFWVDAQNMCMRFYTLPAPAQTPTGSSSYLLSPSPRKATPSSSTIGRRCRV
ncbi:hypothetical protein BV22DRAFT_1134676 [Leucogyrophana mollusca]|uniref:Uncharacterized protein n=1 Tax=Leucogyrophana mollusca TaxID=85980 RepID=A0ACB8AZM9_9AGAM|nr:hypothetical protein BV22DRAFT_1134676 [Leucogyrophana mollusca]